MRSDGIVEIGHPDVRRDLRHAANKRCNAKTTATQIARDLGMMGAFPHHSSLRLAALSTPFGRFGLRFLGQLAFELFFFRRGARLPSR